MRKKRSRVLITAPPFSPSPPVVSCRAYWGCSWFCPFTKCFLRHHFNVSLVTFTQLLCALYSCLNTSFSCTSQACKGNIIYYLSSSYGSWQLSCFIYESPLGGSLLRHCVLNGRRLQIENTSICVQGMDRSACIKYLTQKEAIHICTQTMKKPTQAFQIGKCNCADRNSMLHEQNQLRK